MREALLKAATDGDGRELCARLLEYHQRGARPGWWWYFRQLRMADEELADDSEALGCLDHDGHDPVKVVRSPSRHSSTALMRVDGGEDPREDGTGWTVSAGRHALNRLAVEGQIKGGTAQGLGLALMDEIQVRDGVIVNPNFASRSWSRSPSRTPPTA